MAFKHPVVTAALNEIIKACEVAQKELEQLYHTRPSVPQRAVDIRTVLDGLKASIKKTADRI